MAVLGGRVSILPYRYKINYQMYIGGKPLISGYKAERGAVGLQNGAV